MDYHDAIFLDRALLKIGFQLGFQRVPTITISNTKIRDNNIKQNNEINLKYILCILEISRVTNTYNGN